MYALPCKITQHLFKIKKELILVDKKKQQKKHDDEIAQRMKDADEQAEFERRDEAREAEAQENFEN